MILDILDYQLLCDTDIYSVPGFPAFGIKKHAGMTQDEIEDEVKIAILRLRTDRIFYQQKSR